MSSPFTFSIQTENIDLLNYNSQSLPSLIIALIGNLLVLLFGFTSQGLQDGLSVRTLTVKLSSLGLNPDPAINCHPSVLQAG